MCIYLEIFDFWYIKIILCRKMQLNLFVMYYKGLQIYHILV